MLLGIQLSLFLLDFMREDLVAAGNALKFGCDQVTLIVMHSSDAVIITVSDEDLDIIYLWIIHAAYSTRLV